MPLPKINIVFLLAMVSNAESQRPQRYAEIVNLLPLRFSACGVYPARLRVLCVPHAFCGMAGRLCDEKHKPIY